MDDINTIYFENMVGQKYPAELQLKKAYTSYTEACFLDLYFTISYDTVSTSQCLSLYVDVSRSTSYGTYISQLIPFARTSSHVADFNTCNLRVLVS